MALWKETAQNEQRTMPSEQRTAAAAYSEPIEKAEPAQAPMPPVAPRRESMPRDRNESVLGSGVSIEGQMEGDGDVRIVLLVRLIDGALLTDDLRAEIRSRVRSACTPRHVPAVIAQVSDLPHTRSNKLVELAVVDAVHGRPVRNTEAIVNPEAIDVIVALPELRR